jgi:hypothetical protein
MLNPTPDVEKGLNLSVGKFGHPELTTLARKGKARTHAQPFPRANWKVHRALPCKQRQRCPGVHGDGNVTQERQGECVAIQAESTSPDSGRASSGGIGRGDDRTRMGKACAVPFGRHQAPSTTRSQQDIRALPGAWIHTCWRQHNRDLRRGRGARPAAGKDANPWTRTANNSVKNHNSQFDHQVECSIRGCISSAWQDGRQERELI